MPSDAIEKVLDELTEWRVRFERGAISVHGIRQPKLDPRERWSVKTIQVGTTRVSADEARSLAPGQLGPAIGGAFATDQRVFVANGPKVKRQWRWADLGSVQVLGNWQGVALGAEPDPAEVDVVATDRSAFVSGPSPIHAAAVWLKIEATFAAFRSVLDDWMVDLPQRLETGANG